MFSTCMWLHMLCLGCPSKVSQKMLPAIYLPYILSETPVHGFDLGKSPVDFSDDSKRVNRTECF